MKTDKNDCLIIFVKQPEKGKVKSRLSVALDEHTVLDLYKCFVEDLLQTVKESSFKPVIAFYPADKGDSVRSWLGSEYRYVPQTGDELGERMKNAFLRAFAQGYSRVVLIGSDFPDLPAEIIKDAFASLNDHNAAIGPAWDGGYYLIGFRDGGFSSRIFDDIPWSTAAVFARTMEILREEGCEVRQLRIWRDIDRPEDVVDFIKRNRDKPFIRSKTMACLMRLDRYNTLFPETEK
jgi:rSAM/selenodomain-associated transferase 1